MTCISHSFNTCASYACSKLPERVENFAQDVYNYFKMSVGRRADLKEFQHFVKVDPHNILCLSSTRWLSLELVSIRLIEQFSALCLYFTDAAYNYPNDSREKCRKILEQINGQSTLLYLYFLEWVLPYFNTLDKMMQSEKPQIHLISQKVKSICLTLMDSYMQECYFRCDEAFFLNEIMVL